MEDPVHGRPAGAPVPLRPVPVLLDPQDEEAPPDPALTAYLDALELDLGWGPRSGEHLALALDVGVPDGDPLSGHALVQYLFPVVNRLGVVRFDAVFARKRAGSSSSVVVGPAVPDGAEPGPPQVDVTVTAAATSMDWKEQVHAAARSVTETPAPPGPVRVRVRFTLSRRRNWTALWTPALDALGPILGVPDPSAPYLAQDDRITRLDLHRRYDDTLGDRVRLEVWWSPAGGNQT